MDFKKTQELINSQFSETANIKPIVKTVYHPEIDFQKVIQYIQEEIINQTYPEFSNIKPKIYPVLDKAYEFVYLIDPDNYGPKLSIIIDAEEKMKSIKLIRPNSDTQK